MVAGAAVVWIVVIGAAVTAILRPAPEGGTSRASAIIIGGGVIFPTVGLAALLATGLGLLPDWQGEPARVRIHVQGEQWWWRVDYEVDGRRVASANEVHLPADEPVEIVLTADAVIHSFWIPSLGGKMDMIPGRTNRKLLTGARPGRYRGVCAEYCGASHALMAFEAVVHEPGEFDRWLEAEAAPADPGPARGRELFLANGCAACHRVGGVAELGAVGPDLTHFASRRLLAAGADEVSHEAVAAWIAAPHLMKPEARMPGYGMLPAEEIDAMADWLMSLR